MPSVAGLPNKQAFAPAQPVDPAKKLVVMNKKMVVMSKVDFKRYRASCVDGMSGSAWLLVGPFLSEVPSLASGSCSFPLAGVYLLLCVCVCVCLFH